MLVSSPTILGADDLQILLAVLALAGMQKDTIKSANSDEYRRDVIDGLEAKGWYASVEHSRVEVSQSDLCREANLKVGGAAYRRMNASLARLAMVTCSDLGAAAEDGRPTKVRESKERLLWSRRNERSGKMVVVLNFRSTDAIQRDYVRIDLNKSRALDEMGRLLHLRWCSMVWEGKTTKVETDRLCDMVYGNEPETRRQRSRRKEEIRHGMSVLGRLPGWFVTEHRRAVFEVTRPSRALRQAREQRPPKLDLSPVNFDQSPEGLDLSPA